MLKVIGLGNILRGDDGIGPVVIEELKKSKLPSPLQLLDAGSDAFTVLDHFLGSDPILLIDCARMGKDPGTVQKIRTEDIECIPTDVGMSLHGYSLAEVWQIARSMGSKKELAIIGVEPEKVQFNSGLSEVVKKSIPIIIKMIVEEAKKYAKKDSHHR
jgi:hydrogenase maturation protease